MEIQIDGTTIKVTVTKRPAPKGQYESRKTELRKQIEQMQPDDCIEIELPKNDELTSRLGSLVRNYLRKVWGNGGYRTEQTDTMLLVWRR